MSKHYTRLFQIIYPHLLTHYNNISSLKFRFGIKFSKNIFSIVHNICFKDI